MRFWTSWCEKHFTAMVSRKLVGIFRLVIAYIYEQMVWLIVLLRDRYTNLSAKTIVIGKDPFERACKLCPPMGSFLCINTRMPCTDEFDLYIDAGLKPARRGPTLYTEKKTCPSSFR